MIFQPIFNDKRDILFIDGDNKGVQKRLNDLDTECQAKQIAPRQDDDKVLIAVPTWNIETWLAYLDGQNVNENKKDYPRLKQERDCQKHVDTLYQMCRKGALRQPFPPSLESACKEYHSRIK